MCARADLREYRLDMTLVCIYIGENIGENRQVQLAVFPAHRAVLRHCWGVTDLILDQWLMCSGSLRWTSDLGKFNLNQTASTKPGGNSNIIHHEVKERRVEQQNSSTLENNAFSIGSYNTYNEKRLQILLKEAEFLRAEALFCIGRVRYLAMFSIIIGGAAVPVLISLLAGGGKENPVSADFLTRDRELYIHLITVGISLASAALLQIYVGIFKQVFIFAAYFREILVPDINSTLEHVSLGYNFRPVFQWEIWLQKKRALHPLGSGEKTHKFDIDLTAEPVLISLVCIIYTLGSLSISIYTGNYILISAILTLFISYFLTNKLIDFNKVLQTAKA